MSNTDLKSRIFKELESADDYLLEEILGLIDMESNQKEIIRIPEHYKDALEKSVLQIKTGITVSNTEIQESIDKWLYK